ncbi:hypothetical protein [Thiohalorhabdus sp.]
MTVADEWLERGRQEGRQEGRREGKAAALLRLVKAKFGPEIEAAHRERIEGAGTETLLNWSERILTAETVEEVFR